MIFNLFKSKPTLEELIPSGSVDIHSHILPGIDDGPKNVSESISLITKMKEIGFSKIIGTPHSYPGLYDNTTDSIKKSFEEIHKELKLNINIDYASEYMIEESMIEKARNKTLLCIKENTILIEMSFLSQPLGLYDIIYELKVNGYTPILAHPERYLFLKKNEIYKLKKVGCLFQANLLSSVNYYGEKVSKNLDYLLSKGLIDFVGSDIHHVGHIKSFEKKVKLNNISVFEKIIENNNQFL